MGPAARGFGWGRRIRTPATRARTWCPTPRRSPTKTDSVTNDITGLAPRSADRGLERAARLEARHLRGRDRDFFSRARVATVARGALVHAERAEATDRHAPALAQRVENGAHEGVHREVGGVLGRSSGFGHLSDELGLRHGDYMSTRVTALLSTRLRAPRRGTRWPRTVSRAPRRWRPSGSAMPPGSRCRR